MKSNAKLHALMKGPLSPLYFCIGDPIVGNPTEHMVEVAFASLDYNGRYLTCNVNAGDLGGAMWGLRSLQFAGGNVTAPHKMRVLEYLDELSEAAMLIGAVNCITRRKDGTYYGDNTDGKGFLEALLEKAGSVENKKVVILGSGGAAGAISAELVLAKAGEVVLVNRTQERALSLAKRLTGISSTKVSVQPWQGTYEIDSDAEVVVQATSVGLFSPSRCVDVQFGKRNNALFACDVVFNPVQTLFLKRAQDAGCIAIDGLGMLVNQGALAVRSWTGEDPDRLAMREALDEAFSCE